MDTGASLYLSTEYYFCRLLNEFAPAVWLCELARLYRIGLPVLLSCGGTNPALSESS